MRMVRASALLLLAALVFEPVLAQDSAAGDSGFAWKPMLIGKVSGSQVGFQNWAEGGVNTLALSLGVDGKLERTNILWTQTHNLRLSFGLVKQDTLEFRKSEDLIRLSSSVNFLGDGFSGQLSPTFAFQARTQFAPGFNFKKNPFRDERKPPIKVSDFLSPGTFIQSVGLTYTPNPWFKQRLGIGAKETVVLIERLRSLYGVEEDEVVHFEMGLEGFSELDMDIVTNVRYISTFGVFAAFNKPEKPDIVWESLIAMKVNSWLSVNFEWVLLFDTDVSSKAQFKEVLSVGLSYIFI